MDHGFDKTTLELICSFFKNKNQRIKISIVFSTYLFSSVPQGSLLETLLFNICLKDPYFSYKALTLKII